MSDLAPVNLHFEDSGKWHSLPEWADYFIGIGNQLATVDHSTSRIVSAIVVPTRAYCAAFVSLGMVIGNARMQDPASATAHFEMLFDQPEGTPVIYRQSGRVLTGVLQGQDENDRGELCVKVQVQSKDPRTGGGQTHWINESRSLKVQLANHSGKLPKKQNAKNKQFANAFVDGLLGENDPVQLGTQSKLSFAIVGKKNVLEHEIRHTPLALHANGDCRAEGKLQDVLRIENFTSDKQSYRSAIVPVGPSPPSGDMIGKVEIGVVFDGAVGFLKWGAMWACQHQIIILDRTELHFDDAINAVNSRFIQNREDIEFPLPIIAAPPGGEVLTFREAIP